MNIQSFLKGLFVGFVFSQSQILSAGEMYYYCQIIGQSKVADSGVTVASRETYPVSYHAHPSKFVVNRATGAIVGGVFHNSSADRIEVLDNGSQEQAYKLMSVFGPHISVDYLQIKSFKSQAQKPFSGMSQGQFYSGVCE